jgi:hypothetical protein
MHASPRALARAGIVFLVAVLADNRFDFGTVHFNHPPSAAVHFLQFPSKSLPRFQPANHFFSEA